MPIYEYECRTCAARFERLVRVGAEAPPCPECQSIEVRKLISQSGFILKGGGWYKDHYGLKSGGAADKKSGGDSGAGAGGAATGGASTGAAGGSTGGGSTGGGSTGGSSGGTSGAGGSTAASK